MSWINAINNSIVSNDPPQKTMGLIQGGISAVTVRLQRTIDDTDPEDYPLLLAVLDLSSASLRQTLPHDAQFLAELIKSMTSSVAVTLPEDLRRKAGGE